MNEQPYQWISEYEKSRYLRELSIELLQERYESLLYNNWTTDIEGNVVALSDKARRTMLLRRIVETLCEQLCKKCIASTEFNEGACRAKASSNYIKPKLNPRLFDTAGCLLKFGKKEHIQRTLEEGRLKVSLASTFNDGSLNAAQRDDELQHWSVTPNKRLHFRLYGLDSKNEEVELPVTFKEYFEGLQVVDFYVWCCSADYNARLFESFKADAVLVIRAGNFSCKNGESLRA
ncbi:MAG: hypothetical protein IPK23_08885 [Rhizobiales bacterium]|nr:hypothetical protein [Hyphomicrobiales bacterium]